VCFYELADHVFVIEDVEVRAGDGLDAEVTQTANYPGHVRLAVTSEEHEVVFRQRGL
jgi:hypothetical protein